MADLSLTTMGATDSARAAGVATCTVTVRYFAAARAAAGTEEEPVTLPAPVRISDVIAAVSASHGESLVTVLDRCSFLHNAVAVHDLDAVLADGDQLDVLPPFAGG